MAPQLSAEICLQIIQYLAAIPPTHPTATGGPRLDRQTDLTNCCLVSRTWYDLATPILFRFPVVRSLPKFVAGLDDPPAIGQRTRRQLLRNVERLYIETNTVPVNPEPISEEAIKDYSVSVGDEDLEVCREELVQMRIAEELSAAWKVILEGSIPANELFPRLQTLSTNAVVGAHHVIPWPAAERSERWATLLGECQAALGDFIEKTGVPHYCGTGGPGPLSLDPDNYHVSTRLPGRTLAGHSYIVKPSIQPQCIGLRQRWLIHEYDDYPPCEGCEIEGTCQETARHMVALSRSRRDLASDPEWRSKVLSWDITGELYIGIPMGEAGVPREKEEEECRRRAKADTEAMVNRYMMNPHMPMAGLPAGLAAKDRIEVKSMLDAVCSACSWEGVGSARPVGWYEETVAEMEARRGPPSISRRN